MNRFDDSVLIVAKMIVDSVPQDAIEFFLAVEPTLKHRNLSCVEMAQIYGTTPPAISHRVKLLTLKGYLNRIHYREWELVNKE